MTVRPGTRTALCAAAATLGAVFPFLVATTAWPEIVTPAYFVSRGLVLYDAILFPHTPLLILTTALVGGLAGFSAPLFRAIAAVSLAATAYLLTAGVRPGRSRAGLAAGFLAAIPLSLLWCVYMEGPALWPEPAMAPVVLGAALLLERHERRGRASDLRLAGLLLGAAILIKQTSAWITLAAVAWTAIASARRSPRTALRLLAFASLPYLAFVAVWGIAFRTLSHVDWTLVIPLFTGHAAEIREPFSAQGLHEALGPFLAIPALALCLRALPARRLRSPAPVMALACFGMAWPRFGLLHLAAALGLVSLLLARALLAAGVFLRRARRTTPSPGRLVAFAGGAVALALALLVALLGAGPILADRLAGPTYFWDDPVSRRSSAIVSARVREGGDLFVFNAPNETLYPLTKTRVPGGLYVNPSFWYYLNKRGLDARLVAALARSPGLLVLHREPAPEEKELRASGLYRFLSKETDVVAEIDERTTWRVVRQAVARDRTSRRLLPRRPAEGREEAR